MTFARVLPEWLAHKRELRAHLVHRLGDAHAADDLLQEVFLKLMRREAAFSGIGNVRAWLFRVMRNALIDQARGIKPQVRLPDDLAILQMDGVTQQNAALVDQAAAAAGSMQEQAGNLAQVVSAFKLDGRDAASGAPATPPAWAATSAPMRLASSVDSPRPGPKNAARPRKVAAGDDEWAEF